MKLLFLAYLTGILCFAGEVNELLERAYHAKYEMVDSLKSMANFISSSSEISGEFEIQGNLFGFFGKGSIKGESANGNYVLNSVYMDKTKWQNDVVLKIEGFVCPEDDDCEFVPLVNQLKEQIKEIIQGDEIKDTQLLNSFKAARAEFSSLLNQLNLSASQMTSSEFEKLKHLENWGRTTYMLMPVLKVSSFKIVRIDRDWIGLFGHSKDDYSFELNNEGFTIDLGENWIGSVWHAEFDAFYQRKSLTEDTVGLEHYKVFDIEKVSFLD